jgi:hypothetical protein
LDAAEVEATCLPGSRPLTYTDISRIFVGAGAPGSQQVHFACWGRSYGCRLSGREIKPGRPLSQSLTQTLYLTDISNNRYEVRIW